MKKKVLALMLACVSVFSMILTGCSSGEVDVSTLTPDDYEPTYYTSEEELPEDTYYIVHTEEVTDEDGNTSEVTKYYPLYLAERTYSETYNEAHGYDPDRVVWVNYNVDEGLIPTMYAGDELIYKSSTYIPTTYSLEKFFDNGYTLGVCGLKQDLSGHYKYTSATNNDGDGHVMSTSDAVGFDGLDVDSIYLVGVGDTAISPLNMSMSGTVTDLELMNTYLCDIRTGTEKVAAELTCNIHYFSSAENYMFGSFTFITDYIAQLNIPTYVTSGYYTIGDSYFFRYLGDQKTDVDYHDLTADDYNTTIYTYDEEGVINGTTVGLIFDDNDFLVESTLTSLTDTSNVDGAANTYSDYIASLSDEDTSITITNPTSRPTNDSGYYDGTYVINSISDPVYSGSSRIYTIEAQATDNNEIIDLQYTKTSSNVNLQEGKTYMFTFQPAGSKFDGYSIITATLITSEDDSTTIDENSEAVTDETEDVEQTSEETEE